MAEAAEVISIGPQPGPQTDFLATRAQIAIYGGAAGGGKTYALVLEPVRHYHNSSFGGVIFRKNSTQVRNEGGLWDEAVRLYAPLGARMREANLEIEFPTGARLKFAHLEHEKSVYDWQGAQVPYIGFDELTHFSERQFFYMLSRNRSTSGVPGYVRATCNPDADSWVRRFVDWYISDDGYPIKERSGVLRWFVRLGDVLLWGDSREELIAKAGKDALPKSFTFIPAKLSDNQILMRKDPSYLASLKALQRVDRLRLEGGNWNVRATAGSIFRREWFPIIPAIPNGWTQAIRFWDRASTTPNENNKDPDWTRGLKLLKYPGPAGSPPWYLVADIKSMRGTPGQVEAFIRQVANHDTNRVRIMSQCDPGSAGKSEAEHFVKMLQGFNVRTEILTANKVTRAKPVSAQAEVGNIKVLCSTWNDDFFTEVENFEENCKSHDDQVDTLSGAFNNLCGGSSILNAL